MVIVAYVIWGRDSGQRGDPPTSAEAIARFDKQVEGWGAVEMTPLDQSAADAAIVVASLMSRFEAAVVDNSVAPSSAVQESLFRTLAAHCISRSRPDPAEYLATVEKECGRWLDDRDEKAWRIASEFIKHNLSKDISQNRPDQALSLVYSFIMQEQKGWLTGVGHGPGGASIRFFKVRSEAEFFVSAISLTPEQTQYWLGSSHSALRFRFPRRTLAEVIASDGSALCVDVMAVVQNGAGHRYNWHSYWYWDSAEQCWSCYTMSRVGGKYAFFMYY